MTMRRGILVIALGVVLCGPAGCASSAGGPGTSSIRVVHDKSALGNDVQLVDLHVFKVARSHRGDMNGIARDYARELGADVCLVRVTDDSGPDIMFAVEAYRRIRGH